MAKFRLLDFQVLNLDFKANSFDKKTTRSLRAIKFHVATLGSDEPKKEFGIKFLMTLAKDDDEIILTVESIAHFECDTVVEDDFLASDFAKINAPAIAFPYLRAFISNFTLSVGYNPIFLPTYNFVAMAEENKKKELAKIKKRSKQSKT